MRRRSRAARSPPAPRRKERRRSPAPFGSDSRARAPSPDARAPRIPRYVGDEPSIAGGSSSAIRNMMTCGFSPSEGDAPSEALVEDDAERIEIGARVHVAV